MNILAIECSKDAYDDAQLSCLKNEVLAIDWFGWMKMCVNLWYFESDGIL